MKLCKNCEYFSSTSATFLSTCTHPRAITGPINPVWGFRVYYSCEAMREHALCGAQAILYTPKRNWVQRILHLRQPSK